MLFRSGRFGKWLENLNDWNLSRSRYWGTPLPIWRTEDLSLIHIYDNRYIETLWWLLKQLYKKGLLYKGYTIQPYSPAAGTDVYKRQLQVLSRINGLAQAKVILSQIKATAEEKTEKLFTFLLYTST